MWRFLVNLMISRYVCFLPVVRPGKETAVCHHIVFQQAILKQLMSEVLWSSHWYWIYVVATLLLFEQVESSWQCPFWKAFAAAAGMPKQQAAVVILHH